jgi:hypothetical protein
MIFFCGACRALKKTKSHHTYWISLRSVKIGNGGWVERSGCKFVSDSDRAAARWKFTQMAAIASHVSQPNCNNESGGELCDKSLENCLKMASATYIWWAAAVSLMTVRHCHRQHCQGGKNGMIEQFVMF